MIDVSTFYKPNAMQLWAHQCPKTYICLWGGADAGKSWYARAETLLLSHDFPGNVGIVLRATYRELRDETYPSYKEWAEKFGLLVDEHKADMELIIASSDPDKPSVVRFRSVDKPTGSKEPTAKFGSTEIGWFWIEEAHDPRIKEMVWMQLVKRMRLDGIPFKRGIVTCNPSTPDHWVYRYFYHLREVPLEENETDYAIYLTTTYDNVDVDTKKPYYDVENTKRLESTYTPAWREVFLKGKPAFIPVGKPVWSNFDWEKHGGVFEPIQNRKIIRVWDFGRRRSCVLFAQIVRVRDENLYGLQMQRPPLDRVVFLRELIFDGKTTYRMGDEVVAYTNEEFPAWSRHNLIEDCGDIAGSQKKAEAELSSLEILKKEFGIKVRSRSIKAEKENIIEQIEERMGTVYDGIPMITVDTDRCPILSEALAGWWTRDDSGVPSEDNYYEHVGDCAIYLVANFLTSNQKSRTPIKIQVPTYGSRRSGYRSPLHATGNNRINDSSGKIIRR